MNRRWKLRQAALLARGLLPHKPSPFGALARGALAGAAGAGVQSLLSRTTADMAPQTSEQPARESKPAARHLSGAAWGALYGVCRESARVPASLFGLAVWMLSDNLVRPLLRLAAWPHRSSVKEHASAAEARIVYGLATAAAYALLRDVGPDLPLEALPPLAALQLRSWWRRTPPVRLLRRRESLPMRFFEQFAQRAALA